MNKFKNNKIDILGVKIDQITTEAVLDKIKNFLESNSGHYIATVNPEMIIAAQKDKKFQEIINNADIAIADGIGILFAAFFLNSKIKKLKINPVVKFAYPFTRFSSILSVETINNINLFIYNLIIYICMLFIFPLAYIAKLPKPIPERIAGIDLIDKICEVDFIRKKRIYLLGGGKGIAEKSANILKKKYSYLNIVNSEMGIQYQYNFKKENTELINRINRVKPDILFVAFGAPKQEKWIAENLEKIPSVRLAIGVGGSFDFISGRVKRAPKIVRRIGLEWLWRFLLQPWRAKRIFTATIVFGWKVFWNG